MKIFTYITITALFVLFNINLCGAKDHVNKTKEVYGKASKSIVTIEATANGNKIQGSGVVYANGSDSNLTKICSWIVTNAHVVKDYKEVTIIYNGIISYATVNYFDIEMDLAILRTEAIFDPAEPVGSDPFEIGDRVYSIGSPLGLSNSISEGIISGKRIKNGVQLIQTTAPISPGNSGGGLFNEKGQFVGVTTFKLFGGENINFAVSTKHLDEIRQAQSFAAVLTTTAEKFEIGIDPKDLDWKTLVKYLLNLIITDSGDEKMMYNEARNAYNELADNIAYNNKVYDKKELFHAMIEKHTKLLHAYLIHNKTRILRNDLIRLACNDHGGPPFIANIDYDNKVLYYNDNIKANIPIVISESLITWELKGKDVEFFYSLNRFTGGFNVNAIKNGELLNLGSGKCTKLTERQF